VGKNVGKLELRSLHIGWDLKCAYLRKMLLELRMLRALEVCWGRLQSRCSPN
jgi:hypothetical protein